MPKKPVIINIVALTFFVSPIFILLQTALINQTPLFGSGGILARLFWTDYTVLLLYIVCALAIFSVKKWGWYTFIFSSFYLIGYNIIVFVIKQHYSLIMLISYNSVLTLLAAFFFHRTIMAPYFNPRLRWWETEPRYQVDIFIEILIENATYQGEILDISTSGCFINPSIDLAVNNRYIARIHCLGHTVIVKINVIRKAAEKELYKGYGVMFINLNNSEKEGIRHIINELEKIRIKKEARETETTLNRLKGIASRYEINHSVTLLVDNRQIPGRLWDISANGCFFALAQPIPLDRTVEVEIHCMNFSLKTKGLAKWEINLNGSQKTNFKEGYGFQFLGLNRTQQDTIKAIINTLKKIGAAERRKTATPMKYDALEQSLSNSPYKLVLFLKKMFFNKKR